MLDVALEERRAAAAAAAAMVEPGMRVGLGSGRTALLFVEALGARVADGLTIAGVVPTSSATETAAIAASLDVLDMFAADAPLGVDLTVDGADEIDPALRLMKGGGASLLREKIVARMAKRFVVVADAAKRVERLGDFPLPVEVVPFGYAVTARHVGDVLGVTPELRQSDGGTLVTDNGNYILDCPLGAIDDPAAVSEALFDIPGVVEHGLFLTEAHEALVGTADGVVRMMRPD